MEKTVEVKASDKFEIVPTPYGAITQKKFIKVPFSTYIRRRIDAGELVIAKALKKQKGGKK